MRIAICSQNGRTVTAHPGKCRNFFLFSFQDGRLIEEKIINLAPGEILQLWTGQSDHPLAKVSTIITSSIGVELHKKLHNHAINVFLDEVRTCPADAADYFIESNIIKNIAIQQKSNKPGKGLCKMK